MNAAAAVLGAVLLAACGSATGAKGCPASPGPERGWYYDPRVELAASVTFAGLYSDPDGVLVVLLVDPSRFEVARREIGSVLGVDLSTARFLPAKYDFAQLATWKNVLNGAWTVGPVTGIGISEDLNVVSIGMSDVGASSAVKEYASQRCVPSDAVLVSEEAPFIRR